MSYPTHLICRNGHYYYKAKVPVDLQQFFPQLFIKRSLKTTDLPTAKTALLSLEYQVKKVFAILRTGMLDDEMVHALVHSLQPLKEGAKSPETRAVPHKGHLLSTVVSQYMALKEPVWTPKTKMEMTGVFRLVQEILGDMPLGEVTKQTMIDLRSKLMKLPANRYKRYPGLTIAELLDGQHIIPMSAKSINKHVGAVSALLGYCQDEGMIAANFALGLKISEKRRVDEERSSYTIADLMLIVDNLPRVTSAPERYLIPLIGCYPPVVPHFDDVETIPPAVRQVSL